jgi:hypothetical protein
LTQIPNFGIFYTPTFLIDGIFCFINFTFYQKR